MYGWYSLGAVVLGFLLDLLIGDPHWMWHPVRGIGWLITTLEKGIRKVCPKNKGGELVGGGILVILVISIATALSFGIIFLAYSVSVCLGFGIETWMCYQILATKSLKTESMKVATALETKGLGEGRYAVSMIVGRDTKSLDQPGIIRATIETIAENAADGVIAPLLYLIIGGPAFGFFYKAINTMDSMVGYKNEKYLYFGRIAAKLDDVVNYIPARLCAYFMVIGSFLLKLDGKNAYAIFRRDRYKHASPNSAQTEAVMAGALGIALAGPAYYFGVLHEKQRIGDAKVLVTLEHIKIANKLLYVTATISLLLFTVFKAFMVLWIK